MPLKVTKMLRKNGAKKAVFPTHVAPALAKLVQAPFNDADYLFEVKFDGVRVIAFKQTHHVRLISRNGHDITDMFPEVTAAVKKLPAKDVVIDGEITAVSGLKIRGFQEIQPRLGIGSSEAIDELVVSHPVVLFAFDVIFVNGYAVASLALNVRKEILKVLVPKKGSVQFVPSFPENGKELFRVLVKKGFEGVIAKEAHGTYVEGERIWQKIKATKQQEFIICGWTEGQGARKHLFGALILGAFDPETKKLIHVGNCGTGFNDALLMDLMKRFKRFETKKSPFDEGFYSATKKHWMKLKFVAEIKYAEITNDTKLRKPVFMGLRIDKKPKAVFIEQLEDL